jgi:hypothetical protein
MRSRQSLIRAVQLDQRDGFEIKRPRRGNRLVSLMAVLMDQPYRLDPTEGT